jgi:glucose dehydrogenase
MALGGLMYYTIFGLALVAAISGYMLLRGKKDNEED